jgi:hypothetical protein
MNGHPFNRDDAKTWRSFFIDKNIDVLLPQNATQEKLQLEV